MPIETRSPDKPKPINTGPSQAEGIAKFACHVKHADLTAKRLLRLKRFILGYSKFKIMKEQLRGQEVIANKGEL
jgi:hypothetical protein